MTDLERALAVALEEDAHIDEAHGFPPGFTAAQFAFFLAAHPAVRAVLARSERIEAALRLYREARSTRHSASAWNHVIAALEPEEPPRG
jgi:hypothetical protein